MYTLQRVIAFLLDPLNGHTLPRAVDLRVYTGHTGLIFLAWISDLRAVESHEVGVTLTAVTLTFALTATELLVFLKTHARVFGTFTRRASVVIITLTLTTVTGAFVIANLVVDAFTAGTVTLAVIPSEMSAAHTPTTLTHTMTAALLRAVVTATGHAHGTVTRTLTITMLT